MLRRLATMRAAPVGSPAYLDEGVDVGLLLGGTWSSRQLGRRPRDRGFDHPSSDGIEFPLQAHHAILRSADERLTKVRFLVGIVPFEVVVHGAETTQLV